MALTPDSAATPYLGVAAFLALRDYREVGALALDDSTSDPPTPSALATNAVVLMALAVASGELEAAATRGGRYSVADLRSLAGNSLAFLGGIVAAIAFQRLRERRGAAVGPLPDAVQATKFLADLADGQAVLSFVETQAAGLPKFGQLSRSDKRRIGLPSTISRVFGGGRGCGGGGGGGYGGGGYPY